jgi:uncharacterized protein (TIGR02246 family)
MVGSSPDMLIKFIPVNRVLKMIRRFRGAALVCLLAWAPSLAWADQAGQEAELVALLERFLSAAAAGDAAMHARFWHPDLVYTSSAGKRFGKAELMAGLQAVQDAGADQPLVQYRAQDTQVRVFDSAAIVTFRLVAETPGDADTSRQDYFNTGVFVNSSGQWQAITWQATFAAATEAE